MSRLIDEKELINNRPENLNPNMNDEIKSAYNKGWNACNSEWVNLIDEQPTAYNIDKVIEQLADEAVNMVEFFTDDYRDDYYRGANVAYCNAIEIVKRGGVEE